MTYLLQHTVFASAARHPDRPAFVCGGECLTYAELADRVERLATVLQQEGLQSGDRVGIYLNRCLETAVAIYGILHAGGVFVPLNPKAPAAYNKSVVESCEIDVLVTHPSQRRGLKALGLAGTQVRCSVGEKRPYAAGTTIDWATVYATEPAVTKQSRTVETDLAYIIHTSGSTGTPKGIMHSHASGLAFARNAAARYGLTGDDRIAAHAPIHFDVSQLAYFAAPLVGATAVIATDAETIFPANLGQLMARERITVWYSVPLALTQLLHSGVTDDLDLCPLRYVFYAGEALAPKYLPALRGLFPNATLGNWYGPAETNVCTCYDIPADHPADAPVPIGDVWDNTDRLILDADDRPVAPGETGELLIHATTRMLGYWKLPERSARAWYEQESHGGLPRRFYRTGDLVRENKDGNLYLAGRADQQVKIRGYRIELGAIERLLLRHPAVAEAVAYTEASAVGEPLRLVAAVVATDPKDEPSLAALTSILAEQLPAYSVPEVMAILPDFPRTGTGKIDRTRLRETTYV